MKKYVNMGRGEDRILPPNETSSDLTGDVSQMRSQVRLLSAENERLRDIKQELARQRAGLADFFYALSEPA